MIYTIREWDDPILRAVAEPVEVVDDSIREIVANMIETMFHIGAAGLAANQCGIPKRIMLVARNGNYTYTPNKTILPPIVAINPIIAWAGEERFTGGEGCYSLPGIYGTVTRPAGITLNAKDQNDLRCTYYLHIWESIAAQHELDHLDGIFFTDRASEIWEDLSGVTATYKET